MLGLTERNSLAFTAIATTIHEEEFSGEFGTLKYGASAFVSSRIEGASVSRPAVGIMIAKFLRSSSRQ